MCACLATMCGTVIFFLSHQTNVNHHLLGTLYIFNHCLKCKSQRPPKILLYMNVGEVTIYHRMRKHNGDLAYGPLTKAHAYAIFGLL